MQLVVVAYLAIFIHRKKTLLFYLGAENVQGGRVPSAPQFKTCTDDHRHQGAVVRPVDEAEASIQRYGDTHCIHSRL